MDLRPELKAERAAKRSFQEAASILQAELLEKQAVNGSIDDELTRFQVRLDASETEREALEIQAVEAQLLQDKLWGEIIVLNERWRNEEDAHQITLEELASVRTAKAAEGQLLQDKVTEEVFALKECLQSERASLKVALKDLAHARVGKVVCSQHKNQDRISMATFIAMAACSRARLPHIIPASQPLLMLNNTPCWEASQYQWYCKLCGNWATDGHILYLGVHLI